MLDRFYISVFLNQYKHNVILAGFFFNILTARMLFHLVLVYYIMCFYFCNVFCILAKCYFMTLYVNVGKYIAYIY